MNKIEETLSKVSDDNEDELSNSFLEKVYNSDVLDLINETVLELKD